jgi:hypothetical protein
VLITVKCPDAETLNVIQVCLTSASDAGELIHNEFSFGQGTYTSPTSSTQVTFSNSGIAPVVSQYDIFTGLKGSGFIPSGGSTVTMAGNRFGSDTYVTQPGTQFSFLRTNVSYANTQAGINSLLAAIASPPAGFGGLIPTSGIGLPYTFGSFTNLASSTRDNLYLVYDYRQASGATNLCYDGSKPELACCCRTVVTVYLDAPDLAGATTIYTDAALTTPAPTGYYSDANAGGIGIYRFQTTSGSTATLSPPSTCAACTPGCGRNPVSGLFSKEAYGVWDCLVGAAQGAIVISFPAPSSPVGIRATYDGTVTNLLSAAVTGQRQAVGSGDFTIVGQTASTCPQVPGVVNADNFVANGNSWVSSSGSTSFTIPADAMQVSPNIGNMVMVINKPNTSPNNVKLEMLAPCGGGTTLEATIECPQRITGISIGRRSPDQASACGGVLINVGYFVHTDGSVGGDPQLHSFAFGDDEAAGVLAQGFYAYDDGTTNGGFFTVGVNGIVTQVGTCP